MRRFVVYFALWIAALIPLQLGALQGPPPLNFNGGSLGTVTPGTQTFQLYPTGGTAPYTFSYAPGATRIPGFRVANRPDIPCWASTAATGALLGLPNAPGTYSTTIRLTDATNAFVDKVVSFTVNPVDIISWMPYQRGVGDAVSIRFFGVGGTTPYSFSVQSGTLPPGTTFDPVNGVLSGTLTTAGNYNFTIKMSDSGGNSQTSGFGLTVNPMTLSGLGSRLLPNGTVNLFYSQQLLATGGSPPYTYKLSQYSSLPNGITLSTDGVISGTPTYSSYNFTFSVTVTDSLNHQQDFELALSLLPNTPTPLNPPGGTIRAVLAGGTMWALGGSGGVPPYSYTVASGSSLPPGAIFGDASLIYSDWQPGSAHLLPHVLAPGTYTFTIQMNDSAGNVATRPYTLVVSPLTLNTGYYPACSSEPAAVMGTPLSHNLVPMGGTEPYTITATTLPQGLTVTNQGLLSGTPQEAGNNIPATYTVADSAGNQGVYYAYMQIAAPTGTTLQMSGGEYGPIAKGAQYSTMISATGSPLVTPNLSAVVVGGSLPPGLMLLTGNNFNNSLNSNYAGMIAGVPTAPGSYYFTVRVSDAAGNMGQRQFHMRVSGLNVINSGLPTGTRGQPYNQQLYATGGTPPYTFALTSPLPAGMTLSPSGLIGGTPSTSQAVPVGFQVTDATGDTISRSYTLTIYPFQIATPNVLSNAIYGQPYSITFTTSPPGVYTWTASSVPSGMTLNAATGVLSGIPNTSAATYSFTITAGNGGVAVSKNFTLFVTSAQYRTGIFGLPTGSLGDFLVGAPLNLTLSAYGGTPPYSVTVVSPSSLPPGLSLVPAETYSGSSNFGRVALAGVPAAVGSYNFKLRFTDSAGLSVDRWESLNVTTLSLATTSLQAGTVNTPYSFQLNGVGGTGSYTFALADLWGNVMPPGLNLSPTGLISGTPASTGSFSFTLTMTSGAFTRRISVGLTIYATGTRYLTFSFGPYVADQSVGHWTAFSFYPSGGAGAHTWTILGTLPPGMQLLTGAALPPGYSSPNAILAGIPTTPGTYTFGFRVDDSTGNFGIQYAKVVITPLRLGPASYKFGTTSMLPPGQVGVPFSSPFTVYNGRPPYIFTTLSGTFLPSGLSLSSAGLLSGTPAEAGNFTINLLVTDANGNTLRSNSGLTVYPAGQPIGLSASFPYSYVTQGTPYSYVLNDLVCPGCGTPPFTWTVAAGTLPPGLVIVPGSGSTSATLTGTPTATGSWPFDLLITDSRGAQALIHASLFVATMGLSPGQGVLASATQGTPYTQQFTAAGGTPPYSYQVYWNSDLPPGLSLSATGLLSGTPTVPGVYRLTIQATDAANSTFQQFYMLTVSPAGTPVPALVVAPASVIVNYTPGDPPPTPIQVSINSTSTPLSITLGVSGGPWLQLAGWSSGAPGFAVISINPFGLAAGTYNGVLAVSSAGASNSPATVPVTLSVNSPAPCSYTLGSGAGTILAAGGPGNFTVNTSASCAWAASTTAAWITLGSPGSGSGNGTINFTAAVNPGSAPRTGTITVQGLTYTVTQFGSACAYTITPSSLTVPASAGTASVTLNSSAAGCQWGASGSPWLQIQGTSSGSDASSVTVRIAIMANPAPSSRAGSIIIAGVPFTVTQAGTACSYSLSSPEIFLGPGAASDWVYMNAPAGCLWTVDPGPSWITAISGTMGMGAGTVALSVAANSSTTGRSARVLIGGQSYTITQQGVPCSFSLSATNPMQPAAGGSGSILVNPSIAGCPWVVSSSASWLTPSSTSGAGNGSVSFTVASNTAANARSGTLTVAGQNVIVNQSGQTCSYTLRSPSASIPSGGGASAVDVITAPGCSWSAASQAPGWLSITGGASNTGSNTVTFNVLANAAATARTGTIAIADQAFSVTESRSSCAVTLNGTQFNAGGFGGNGSFTYTTSVSGCPQVVQSYTSWITVTSSTYSGNTGTVNFSADANTYAAARSGTIKVGDQAFVVNEAASTCSYTLESTGASFTRLGGDGSVPVSYSPPACGTPALLLQDPTGMVVVGPLTSSPAVYTQSYSVGIFQSFINYVRTAQYLLGGQIYQIKQTSY